MARARSLIRRASGPPALQSGLLLVDADDFIGLLFHAHRRGVDAIRNGLVKRLALTQERFDLREPVKTGFQQRAMLGVLCALVRDVRIHPATDDDAGAAEIAKFVRIEHHAAARGDDPVLPIGLFANERPFLLTKKSFALLLKNLRNRLPMTLFDHVVHVRESHSKLLRRALAGARLAAAHEPYEDKVLHRAIV